MQKRQLVPTALCTVIVASLLTLSMTTAQETPNQRSSKSAPSNEEEARNSASGRNVLRAFRDLGGEPDKERTSDETWHEFFDQICGGDWILSWVEDEDGNVVAGSANLHCLGNEHKLELPVASQGQRRTARREIATLVLLMAHTKGLTTEEDDRRTASLADELDAQCDEWIISWVEDEDGNIDPSSIEVDCDGVVSTPFG